MARSRRRKAEPTAYKTAEWKAILRRRAQPYDGVVGTLPDHVSHERRSEFEAIQARLFRAYPEKLVRQWFEAYCRFKQEQDSEASSTSVPAMRFPIERLRDLTALYRLREEVRVVSQRARANALKRRPNQLARVVDEMLRAAPSGSTKKVIVALREQGLVDGISDDALTDRISRARVRLGLSARRRRRPSR